MQKVYFYHHNNNNNNNNYDKQYGYMCHANHMLHVGTSADQIILNPNEMLMQQCNVGRAYVGVDKNSIYGRYGWG